MASVSSLDKDLRKVRLDKYTPASAKEARQWIEGILNEPLPSSDLLEGLKDGVALCRLINLTVPPPEVKYKQSAMPFVQMENISHFLRTCQAPPLNLQQHDMFLTVDLYENKDPAQVLQCLSAFSRAAHRENPARFPTYIGPKSKGSVLSPQSTGPPTPIRHRGMSNASNASSIFATRSSTTASQAGDAELDRLSPTKNNNFNNNNNPASPGLQVSSWSRKEHEGSTSPAWNIAQYGYLGGASQGNLGIAFGGRRQITSAKPQVPSIAERLKRQKEEEEERQRLQLEDARQRKAQMEAEEERARKEEESRWREETRRIRDEGWRKAEEEKRKWEEEERMWRITEEERKKEEAKAEEARLAQEHHRTENRSDVQLRGQYLSQYQAEQAAPIKADDDDGYLLETELELARQREREYERERAERAGRAPAKYNGDDGLKVKARSKGPSGSGPGPQSVAQSGAPSRQDSWSRDEREVLRTPKGSQHGFHPPVFASASIPAVSTVPAVPTVPAKPARPLPDPTKVVKTHHTGGPSRPLPNPTAYAANPPTVAPGSSAQAPPPPVPAHRVVDRVEDKPSPTTPAPVRTPSPAKQTYFRESDSTAEWEEESQGQKSKAIGQAPKSLLEREMEMERQRQREWEEAQLETEANAANGAGDAQMDGIGGRWDVSQWSGFTGGDGQTRGSQGIGANRRPITGPRPLPNTPR